MATRTQLREHRRAVADLSALAFADITELLRQVDNGEQAREGLMDLLPMLTATYGTAAATLAADWYDDLRDESDARGRFRAIPAEPPDRDRTDALARWSVEPMFSPEPDKAKTLSLAAGGLQRVIANADRFTIVESVQADPAPTGYVRVASGSACAFCKMLATRGAAYNSAASASTVVGRGTALSSNQQRRMGRRAQGIRGRGTQELGSKYHDHCNCVAQPVWGDYEEPPEVGEWRAAYDKAFGQLKPGTEDYTSELLSNMRQILGSN
jgi:hypothetical protein